MYFRISNTQEEETVNLTEQKEEQIEIVDFEDSAVRDEIEVPTLMDSTFDEDNDEIGHLADFLKRPTLINLTDWIQTAMPNPVAEYYPFVEYLTKPAIRAKIQNYCRFRGKLHLKFVVNASPFYYGAMRIAWFPLNTLFPSANLPYELVPGSQAPGVWITPQNMSTAELTLPWITPLNWIDPNITNDLAGLGKIRFMVYSQLASANGANGATISISTYAWFDEIELAGPTNNATLQAKAKRDDGGKISGLAEKVSTMTGKLSGLPIVGSYASAASVAAGAVGKVAAMFGFSNEPNTKDVDALVPKAFHSFANCETSVPNDVLAIDPKNQVTVDTRVAGSDGEDPLALANFMRESYFGQVNWATTTPENTNLGTMAVSPAYDMFDGVVGGSKKVYHTPMAYAARMFKLWRGSIIFRFKIIKTKYHKGRVRIVWDPSVDITSATDTTSTNFNKVVDLEVDDEVEFEVPYKALSIWLQTTSVATPIWNTSEPTATTANTNGFLSLKVLNRLTAPVATSYATILCFMRPGSDFQFSVPNELPPRMTKNALQAQPTIDGSGVKTGANLSEITVGEHFASLRPLIHRSSLNFRQVLGSQLSGTEAYQPAQSIMTMNLIPRMPFWNGNALTGTCSVVKFSDNTKTTYNTYAKTHPLRWVTACFAGYRGSTVINVDIHRGSDQIRIESASLTRYPASISFSTTKAIPNGDYWGNDIAHYCTLMKRVTDFAGTSEIVPAGQRGMSITKEITQAALSVTLPQYSPVRFMIPSDFQPGTNLTNSSYGDWYDNIRLDTTYVNNTAPTGTSSVPYYDCYYAGGVDFQPIFFVCTPILYQYQSDPTPYSGYTVVS